MRLKSGLVKRTVLRTAPGVFEERHASWLELFHDLTFVAVLGQISASLAGNFDFLAVLKALVLFVPVWWAWVGEAYFLSRFDSDDLGQRLFALVQIILVAGMAVSVPAAFQGDAGNFALCYAALRVLLVIKYLVAGWHLKRARPLAVKYGVGFGLAALVWILSAYVDPSLQVVLWGVAIAIDVCTPLLAVNEALEVPPDYSHVPERFGLFTIIVLGEAILAAVAGMHGEKFGTTTQVIGSLGLVVAFTLWWLYFDGVKGHQVQMPRLRKDMGRIMVWQYSHLPLTFGIVVGAVAVEKAMHADESQPLSRTYALGLTFALSLVMIALHAIYFSGLNPKLLKLGIKIGLPHFLTTIGIFASLLLVGHCAALPFVLLQAFLCVLHVLWTLRDLPEMDELLLRVESAKRQTASNV